MSLPDLPVRVRHLLAPSDLSGHGNDDAARAAELAGSFGARVTWLHVLEALPTVPEFAGALGDVAQHRQDAARQALDKLSRAHPGPPGTDLVLREGRPFEEIVGFAATHEVDLIVLGRGREPGLLRQLLGSTSERVVRHAPCPVLVCGASPAAGDGPVLLATDLSEPSAASLPWAQTFARALRRPWRVVHVEAPLAVTGTREYERHASDIDALRAEMDTALDRWVAERVVDAPLPECRVLEGPPYRELCREAERVHAPLLVLATQGASGWPQALIGTTAERVVRHATGSVLVIPG